MANVEHLQRLKQRRDQWNQWRNDNPNIRPDLRKADLHDAHLFGVDLHEANLFGANLRRANLGKVNLRGASLRGANLRGADLRGAELQGTDLSQSYFIKANLSETNLFRAYLGSTDLREARLFRANLNYVDLHRANLHRADLREASLRHADLSQADLNRAHLFRADLSKTNLSGTHFHGANLSEADLSEANLHQADLSEANLSEADLSEANLSETNLYQTNLSGTHLQATTIAKVDLRAVRGLVTIQHLGPSHIEPFSVQLPPDGSALHFLRGTGVPDEWIDFWRATMTHPIQYHSCFISYSSTDETIARRLHADLQAQGVRCWFAPEDLKIGDKIRKRIDEAIYLQDKLLLLLSTAAVMSDWVETEVEAAFARERKENREILFPICLDEAVIQTPQAWAKHLQNTRYIGDFTDWANPQQYHVAFNRLLRDLKSDDDL